MCKCCKHEYTGLELLLQDKIMRKQFATLKINVDEKTKEKVKKAGRINRILAYIRQIFN